MKKNGYLLLLFISASGCIQKFQPVLSSPATGYLVVEGIINGGGGPASVTLSRTTAISDSSFVSESGAMVQVEGSDSSIYAFAAQGNGVYGTNQLSLNPALQYRLRIKTVESEEYLSDFAPFNVTPSIDSLSWQTQSGGVQIYASTHDPEGNTRYYKWDYQETWEFHMPFIQQLRYDTIIDPATLQPEPGITPLAFGQDTSGYTCWQSAPSTQILIGSSINLSSDVIADFPISFIPSSSQKISVEYSTLVNQYALTAAEFNFLSQMQKNTEETGSVFGAEPTELQGNIHCLTKPAETVVGYVGFSTVQSKRIFIFHDQLPISWISFYPGCAPDTVLTYVTGIIHGDPYNEIKGAVSAGLIPISVVGVVSGGHFKFLAAPPVCVDCTLIGTNIKPSFWQ